MRHTHTGNAAATQNTAAHAFRLDLKDCCTYVPPRGHGASGLGGAWGPGVMGQGAGASGPGARGPGARGIMLNLKYLVRYATDVKGVR